MLEIIDLSQEIFSGMPVFPGLPEVMITVHVPHEQWDGMPESDVVSPAVNRLELGEHTGTHVDAINHMAPQYRGQLIEWEVRLYALLEPDQFAPAHRPGAFSLYWSAAQDSGRDRLACTGHCFLQGVR
jgi:hypothetical protein